VRAEQSEPIELRPPLPLDRLRRPHEPTLEYQRNRLLAGLTLVASLGLLLGLPFALRAGAEFFLPVTAAMIIAIALVPLLEWLERHGVPSGIAAFASLFVFLVIANAALASIVVPATEWFRALPDRIPQIQANLAPLIDFYSNLQKFVDETVQMLASGPVAAAQASAVGAPSSIMDYVSSAPHAAIQLVFAILVIYFFLSGWTCLRERTITSRGSFGGALTTARVIQNVVDSTSAYLGTITLINVTLGLLVALALWLIGMPSPLMWGGIVALLNYVPYIGPILAAPARAWRTDDVLGHLDGIAACRHPGRPARGRSECRHACHSRQAADHQPAADPPLAELLGLGMGHARRAAGGAAPDHHSDRDCRGRQAGHCGFPVRRRDAGRRRARS